MWMNEWLWLCELWIIRCRMLCTSMLECWNLNVEMLELQCRDGGTSTYWMVVQCMCIQNNDKTRHWKASLLFLSCFFLVSVSTDPKCRIGSLEGWNPCSAYMTKKIRQRRTFRILDLWSYGAKNWNLKSRRECGVALTFSYVGTFRIMFESDRHHRGEDYSDRTLVRMTGQNML